jgi:thymidylate synthase (FAD)
LTVKLIGITKPVNDQSAEDLISYCARVSNPKNQENYDTSGKLLKYLLSHKHFSPFEMVHVVMEIETTRDIGRQILRHRSFAFQEFSQRYADPTTNLEFTRREARLQDHSNRQNSIETDNWGLQKAWEDEQKDVEARALAAYKWAIDSGIAKEQARAVLPEGLTMSRMYMAGSLRSWIHYCEVRTDVSTQKEHRLIADECWTILVKEFPFLNE